MLTEAQIQRYARHILLPEVGGAGQEKLCSAEVHISGESLFVELAGDYLSAAGVKVDAHSGRGLSISLRDERGVSLAVDGDDVVCVPRPSAGAGPLPLESGFLGACLAASEMLRIILELGPAHGWRIRGAHVERLP